MTPYDKKQADTNALFTECQVFWAFSQKQFDENKTPLLDGEKYVEIGAGGYMPKSNVDKLIAGMKKINNDFKQAMQDDEARKAHIKYQLNNHEAYYTHSIESTLDALGEDFTREEVLSVFDGRRKVTKN
jgi:hypothetical protein